MKTLLTGDRGFIGSHLREALMAVGSVTPLAPLVRGE